MRETASERGVEAGKAGLLSPLAVCYGTCNTGNNIGVMSLYLVFCFFAGCRNRIFT